MTTSRPATPSPAVLRRRLLAWYDREQRRLPWRAPPGLRPDPYGVWLSEIMLQQTTVAAVRPYFEAFVARWPRLGDLAAASLDDVLVAWQGLGYYARARRLHACARWLSETRDGVFPDSEDELRRLPGVGAYTAAAIAAIAFDRRATPVDGNVARVVARLHAVTTPLPQARDEIAVLAGALTPSARPGDFAQAMMDLGATVCLPRRPRCDACPWRTACRALGAGDPEAFPVAAPKRPRPLRHGVAFWIERADGTVLLRRRPETGLLGGMMEVPTTAWRERPWPLAEALAAAPAAAEWRPLPGVVDHVFTHFRLTLSVAAARVDDVAIDGDGSWCAIDDLGGRALPTVMRKVVTLARRAGPPADGPDEARQPTSGRS
jgi:A/G-specific adenine glycosylase